MLVTEGLPRRLIASFLFEFKISIFFDFNSKADIPWFLTTLLFEQLTVIEKIKNKIINLCITNI